MEHVALGFPATNTVHLQEILHCCRSIACLVGLCFSIYILTAGSTICIYGAALMHTLRKFVCIRVIIGITCIYGAALMHTDKLRVLE